MNLKSMLALSLFLLSLVPSAAAQNSEPFKIVRDKVLSEFGQVVPASYVLYPVATGTGRIFQQPIQHVGGSSMRLRFKIDNPARSTAWRVEILDANRRKAWFYTEMSPDEDEFWSDEILTPSATVEVYSNEPNSTLRLRIDRIAIFTRPSEPNAITAPNQLGELLRSGSPLEINWGKAIARLRFVSEEDSRQYYCTGFLISPSLFLTNNHCIRTKREMRSALVDFDYQLAGQLPKTHRFKELLCPDPELDFTLLRLDTSFPETERKALKLHIADLVVNRKNLVIIQHPAGKIQHLSRADCYVREAKISGVTQRQTDFGHMCDTKGGSSGSPVQDVESGQVYGLHHLGFDPQAPPSAAPKLFNRAVHMKMIIEQIKKLRPDLSPELPAS